MRNVPMCRIYEAFNSRQSIEFFCFVVAFGLQEKKLSQALLEFWLSWGIGAICINTRTKQQIFPRF